MRRRELMQVQLTPRVPDEGQPEEGCDARSWSERRFVERGVARLAQEMSRIFKTQFRRRAAGVLKALFNNHAYAVQTWNLKRNRGRQGRRVGGLHVGFAWTNIVGVLLHDTGGAGGSAHCGQSAAAQIAYS